MAEALARDLVVQGFDPVTGELWVELPLRSAPIDRLRSLFDVGDDREMCNAYPLDAARARALEEFVAEEIDTRRYDFFLRRYA